MTHPYVSVSEGVLGHFNAFELKKYFDSQNIKDKYAHMREVFDVRRDQSGKIYYENIFIRKQIEKLNEKRIKGGYLILEIDEIESDHYISLIGRFEQEYDNNKAVTRKFLNQLENNDTNMIFMKKLFEFYE